ncbi:hypothetical protein KY321_02195 [Candidatus Woesearchaeota archaeon]|nr:hypothetical protein [Candidatus Woesearchaeota archaeon]
MDGQELLIRLSRLPTLYSDNVVFRELDDGFLLREGYLALDYFKANNKVFLFIKPYIKTDFTQPTIRIKSSGKRLEKMICEEVSILPFCNDPNYKKITNLDLNDEQLKHVTAKLRTYLDILNYESYVVNNHDKFQDYSAKTLKGLYNFFNQDLPGLSKLPTLRNLF